MSNFSRKIYYSTIDMETLRPMHILIKPNKAEGPDKMSL